MVCGAGGKYATRLTQPQREADILNNSWYFARSDQLNIQKQALEEHSRTSKCVWLTDVDSGRWSPIS